MFEIGFSEIILVAIVALVVFGPDKLPGLARDIGLWTGRIRRMINSVQQDVQRELSRADELKRLVEEQQNILDRHIILDDSAPTVPVTGKVAPPVPAEAPPQAALPTQAVTHEPITPLPAAAQVNPEPLPEQHALPLGTPVDVKTNQAN
ncbi:MAG: twin-arginine translocase subunit TatB [Gammaproteobacteria bacterium]|nr:twin-arginine translocase subunit TatB [Gammaproteobacteria bacterium]